MDTLGLRLHLPASHRRGLREPAPPLSTNLSWLNDERKMEPPEHGAREHAALQDFRCVASRQASPETSTYRMRSNWVWPLAIVYRGRPFLQGRGHLLRMRLTMPRPGRPHDSRKIREAWIKA
jgi:hypothetical protein